MGNDELYWLHVPFESRGSDRLGIVGNGRMTVLERPARLCQTEFPMAAPGSAGHTTGVVQWLLFDPMPKVDAEKLFIDLRARFRYWALQPTTALQISDRPLNVAAFAIFNGPYPTLIPSRLIPQPAWLSAFGFQTFDGKGVLSGLNTIPSISDERLLAALDLVGASRYETSPRSVFLTLLTIVDSLAVPSARPERIRDWLDRKIQASKMLGDQSLTTALGNLKQVSHTSAVRSLVARAATFKGCTSTQVRNLSKLASDLYGMRSKLSHAGKSGKVDIVGARQLVAIVLEAACAAPTILDAESVADVRRRCSRARGKKRRQRCVVRR
jgi:hypothetical protein